MSAWLRIAVASCRGWTALYTRGLDETQRNTRRAEIESDLWEHQQSALVDGEKPADTGFEILIRFLLGIPADLSWRYTTARLDRPQRDRRSGERTVLNRLFVAIATAITVFVGAWLLYMGFGRALSGAGLQEVAVLPVAAGLAMIGGVLVVGRSPRVGTSMVILGVLTPVLMFPWMIAITLPIALISILGNLARGRAVQASV